MKVFISWSGEPSRSIARALDTWLESVVQHVEVWMSDEEIGSGARWNVVIADSLEDSNFGIVCVTRANQHAPWLIFEVGALSKSTMVARVVPLYVDLAPSDVTGPLSAFQGRVLDKEGMRRLVRDISDVRKPPMPREQVDALFEAMWPRLKKAIDKALKPPARRAARGRASAPARGSLGTGVGSVVHSSLPDTYRGQLPDTYIGGG